MIGAWEPCRHSKAWLLLFPEVLCRAIAASADWPKVLSRAGASRRVCQAHHLSVITHRTSVVGIILLHTRCGVQRQPSEFRPPRPGLRFSLFLSALVIQKATKAGPTKSASQSEPPDEDKPLAESACTICRSSDIVMITHAGGRSRSPRRTNEPHWRPASRR